MKWTINAAAKEWGMDHHTMEKRLRAAGFAIAPRMKLHTKQITKAIVGDLATEKIRETSARADLLELERKEREEELVPMASALRVITEFFQPLDQALAAFATDNKARANPSDPEHAGRALEPAIREIRQNASNRLTAIQT